MVQSTATHGKPKPARKTVYRPRITFLSATEYLVPSERFAGHIIYKVTVMPSGRAQCECKASDMGRACKHGRLALAAHAYRLAPTHQRPTTPEVAAVAPAPASLACAYSIRSWGTSTECCDSCGQQIAKHDPICLMRDVLTGDNVGGYCSACASKTARPQVAPAPAFVPAPPAFSELFAA